MLEKIKQWFGNIVSDVVSSHMVLQSQYIFTSHSKLDHILKNQEQIMASVQDVQSQVVLAASTVTSIETSVAQLKTQLANSSSTSGITPTQLDPVFQDLQNLNTNLQSLSSAVSSLITPVTPPTA